jgi:hypothetical protein
MAQNASIKPITGERRRDSKVSVTFFIGSITFGSMKFITRDTQRIDPMSV